ncbi:DUF2835 family protein [Catenovulum maritimum]|uniref:DUF2835 family protein n=1 Tax=Catenovulum maritimum TaxID=1513271 RepID=UPI00097CB94C|nr:DUF2835 family protein [Catenovulum maritimum]
MSYYQIYFFSLDVSYQECSVFYTGQLPNVLLISECGKRIQVPTSNLRRFINSSGLKGRFRMLVDSNNKIMSFEQTS